MERTNDSYLKLHKKPSNEAEKIRTIHTNIAHKIYILMYDHQFDFFFIKTKNVSIQLSAFYLLFNMSKVATLK